MNRKKLYNHYPHLLIKEVHLIMDRRFRLRTILTDILLLIFVSSAISDKKTDAADKLFSQWDNKDTPGCALAIVKAIFDINFFLC